MNGDNGYSKGYFNMTVNDEYDYLIHLIACAIHNRKPSAIPEALSFEKVLQYGIEHDVANIAYISLRNAEVKPSREILEHWRQRYLLAINRHASQEQERAELLDLLHKNGIATLELQGTKVKQYYPSPDLRMMNDIDFIIEEQHLSQAADALAELGYQVEMPNGFEVNGYKTNSEIEIHTDFFPPQSDFYGILEEPFHYAKIDGEFNASVSNTVFYLYNLLHCLKHSLKKGAGIRRLLDLYVLEKALSDDVDSGFINDVLARRNLTGVLSELLKIAHCFFDGIEPDECLSELINNVKSAGTQGNIKILTQNQISKFKTDGSHFPKLRYFNSLVFPSKKHIFNTCPLCRKYNFPYPIAWFCRTSNIIFKQHGIKGLLEKIYHIHKTKG